MPSPSAAAISAAEIVGTHHGAGRVGRACDQHAFQRRAAVRGEQRIDGERPARLGRDLDHHRLAAERGEDMPVRRIARARDRDAVARLEQREEREDESGRRAGRHHHALGLDRDAVSIRVMPRDPVAQSRHAERRRVADVAEIERGLGGLARDARRGRGRLADLHVHHAPALRLDARGGRHHVHHHERRNVAAGRRSEQRDRRLNWDGATYPIRRKAHGLCEPSLLSLRRNLTKSVRFNHRGIMVMEYLGRKDSRGLRRSTPCRRAIGGDPAARCESAGVR